MLFIINIMPIFCGQSQTNKHVLSNCSNAAALRRYTVRRVYDVRPNGHKAKWKRPKNKGLTDERPNEKNAKWTKGQKDIWPKNDNHAKVRNVKTPNDQKPNEMAYVRLNIEIK